MDNKILQIHPSKAQSVLNFQRFKFRPLGNLRPKPGPVFFYIFFQFDILKSAPPRHTISWEKGFMTTNQDYFRRSQNQLQALQEILLDQQESICSEGF